MSGTDKFQFIGQMQGRIYEHPAKIQVGFLHTGYILDSKNGEVEKLKSFQFVQVSIENGIAFVTLNRPEAMNSFNSGLFQETAEAIRACDTEEEVKAVVLTGAGRHFSAGGDIQQMAASGFRTYRSFRPSGEMAGAVKQCGKPVIAAVNGSAAGAGFALALACDFRILTEKSKLITAFSNVALSGDAGCMYHLYHTLGLAKTIELMALSEPINASEALRLGLATKVVPEEKLMEEARGLAERLKNGPLFAFAMQKKICWETFYHDYDAYCRLEADLVAKCSTTEDHAEAVAAFLEKRKPVFRGK